MKNKYLLFFLHLCCIGIMFSCITSKTAQKNFNNAEFNTAAYKYQKLLKEVEEDLVAIAKELKEND